MRLTGGQIVTRTLMGMGIPWIAGIPGHGCLPLVDAFYEERDRLPLYLVRHEQSAAHMADGYYRVTGEPATVFTSIGPGAMNLAVGLGTAYVDSTAMLALIGETHSYMAGRGVLQEIERVRPADSLRVLEPLSKYAQHAARVEQLPTALRRAFRAIKTGRAGPAVIALPMDVQAETAELEESVFSYQPTEPGRPCGSDVSRAATMIAEAKRPLIVVGGGALRSGASAALVRFAETVQAAVITTMAGKSAFPEDHPLYAWHAGSKGTGCGNKLAAAADLILAVGCRFADETTSSYRRGASFNIPPTKLIQIDIDQAEIGKNYPVETAITADARLAIEALLEELKPVKKKMAKQSYREEIETARDNWQTELEAFRDGDKIPITVSGVLREIRAALPRDGYLVTSSGHSQAQVLQEFPFYEPGTLVTTGGFSTMGFAFPAALGVKLARPAKTVVALAGDGDFLMTAQELATAAQYGLDVIAIILNNSGFLSIRDLQTDVYGEARQYATEFTTRQGEESGTDFKALAGAFNVAGETVFRPGEVQAALKRAIQAGGPRLIEVKVNRRYPWSGGKAAGWWDVPVPEYLEEKRAAYEKARSEIQA